MKSARIDRIDIICLSRRLSFLPKEQGQTVKKTTFLTILSPILFLFLWQLLRWFKIINPYYIPGPSDLIITFIFKLFSTKPDGSTLLQHTLSSVITSLTGFLLAVGVGVPLGLFMGWKKTIDRAVRPTFDIFRQIPSPHGYPSPFSGLASECFSGGSSSGSQLLFRQ